MKKLIASITLGLAVLGFAGASFAQAASAPAVAASAAAMAPATATAPAAAASAAAAPAPVPNKGDTAFMTVATALVILMTIPGLALFYGGLVRSKNMLSVLMHIKGEKYTIVVDVKHDAKGVSIAYKESTG